MTSRKEKLKKKNKRSSSLINVYIIPIKEYTQLIKVELFFEGGNDLLVEYTCAECGAKIVDRFHRTYCSHGCSNKANAQYRPNKKYKKLTKKFLEARLGKMKQKDIANEIGCSPYLIWHYKKMWGL